MCKLRHLFFGLFAVLLLATLGMTTAPATARAADPQWHAPHHTPATKKTPTASFELRASYVDQGISYILFDGRVDLFAKKGAAADDFTGATGTITLNGATRTSGKVTIFTTKGNAQMLITGAVRKEAKIKTVVINLLAPTTLPTGTTARILPFLATDTGGITVAGDATFYNSSTNTSYKFAMTDILTQGPAVGYAFFPPATNPTTNVVMVVNKFNMVVGGSITLAPDYVIPVYGGRVTLGSGGSPDTLTFFAPGPVPHSTGTFTGTGTWATRTFTGTNFITEPTKGQTYGTWNSVAGT